MRRLNEFSTGLLLVSVACGGPDNGASEITVRDSAGVRIVEAPYPISDLAQWQLGDAPTVEIGVVEGNPVQELQFAVSATRLDDGTLVIANAESDELRAFDVAGRHLWSAGRDGEGPGEFRNLGWVKPYSDSLATYDRSLRRVSIFTQEGEFVRVVRLEPPPRKGFSWVQPWERPPARWDTSGSGRGLRCGHDFRFQIGDW